MDFGFQPDTREEDGTEEHIGADVDLARDVIRIADVAENDAGDIGPGDIGDPEKRSAAKANSRQTAKPKIGMRRRCG